MKVCVMRCFAIILVGVLCGSCQHHFQTQFATTSEKPGVDPNRWLCDSHFEGVTYVFAADQGLLHRASIWRANSERPPLSPRAAEALAIKEARRLRPDVKEWAPDVVNLYEIDDTADCWVYLVFLIRADIVVGGQIDLFEIPVLMSGVAVPPISQH